MAISWADDRLGAAMLELDSEASPVLAAAFLRRHKLNVAEASAALAKTMAWRLESGAEDARKRVLADLEIKDFPFSKEVLDFLPQCDGGEAVDKRGVPYAIRCPGLADAVGLFKRISEDDLMLFQIYLNEWRLLQLEAHALKSGELCGFLIVQDMLAPEGLLNAWRRQGSKASVMRRVTAMIDEHYPGIMEKVLLVNAPWALHALMKLVVPLLPPRIAEKCHFVSAEQTAPRLLELIEASRLPRSLGGEAEEWIERKVAVVPKLLVKPGCSEMRRLAMEKEETAVLSMQVEGEGQDICLKVYFESEAGSLIFEERLQEKSLNHTAGAKGELVVLFDNTYSWLKAKSIQFELEKMPELPESADGQLRAC